MRDDGWDDEADQLGALVAEYSEKINELREALMRILQWAEAYPTRVFHEPSLEQYALAQKLLVANGMTLGAFSASIYRHCLKGVGDIARDALNRKDQECTGQ
jgi:TRAP-type mannitol/chloroaromatic compound transport system substrate-binding protein